MLLTLLSFACRDAPTETTDCALPRLYADSDGDGFGDSLDSWYGCDSSRAGVEGPGDCDDADPEVHPDVPRDLCDGTDQDCDGLVDEDEPLRAWFTDDDLDGWGGTALGSACVGPAGAVDRDGDCADDDPGVHPEVAADTCDSVDQDCDGLVDEDAPPTSWYTDADHDGWGGDEVAVACVSPPDGVDHTGDCDDADAGVHPDGLDICNNGVDDDCDGVPSCGIWGTAALGDDGFVITGAAAGDRFGDRVIVAGDVNRDGHGDLLVTSADQTVDLVTGDASASASSAGWATFTGLGLASSAVLDSDGDGELDVLLGDSADDGTVWWLRGPFAGEIDVAAAAAGSWTGLPGQSVGLSVVRLGDTDGDGREEAAVAGVEADGDGDRVFVFTPTDGSSPLDDAGAVLVRTFDAQLCCAVNTELLTEIGDADGDGLADLLIGERGQDTIPASAGRVDLVLGPFAEVAEVDDAGVASWRGETVGDRAGYGTAAGDLDGDGLPEVAIGADLWNNQAGVVYVVPASDRGTVALAGAPVRIEGGAGANLGRRLAYPGDVDGDGIGDLAINAGFAGALYVLHGPFAGTIDVTTIPDVRTGSIDWTPVAGGDVDGDGFGDVVVGVDIDDRGGVDAGAVFVSTGGSF